MTNAEDSPFESCFAAAQDEAAEALDTSVASAAPARSSSAVQGVASMLDSPFASGPVAPQLLEQLTSSLASATDSEQSGAAPGGGRKASADGAAAQLARPAAAKGGDAAAGAGAGVQGVASILESPFASTCLSSELKNLNLDLAGELAKASPTAAAQGS